MSEPEIGIPKARHAAYLGLGSNIEPRQNFDLALEMLRGYVELGAVSSFWKTPPVGSPGPMYLNACAYVTTELTAPLLKTLVLHRIEALLGRKRTSDKNAPRPIDLDILIFDGEIVEPKLWGQPFLLAPLSELLPDLRHPHSGQTLADIARQLRLTGKMHPIS